jgi:hypothetical protein
MPWGDSPLIGRTQVAAACFALVAASMTATAETFRYDPALCSTESYDQVFVRLQSGLAFVFPADDLFDPGYDPTNSRGPVILEPEGCPRHPLVRSSVGVAVHPAQWPSHGVGLHGHEGPTRVQDVALLAFNRCAANPDNPLRRVSAALEECRLRQSDGSPEEDWRSFIRAVPGAHPEFAGRLFAVMCFSAYHPGAGRACTAGYQVEPGLSISYRFYDDQVPQEDLATFDVEVRALVSARRSPEYDLNRAE